MPAVINCAPGVEVIELREVDNGDDYSFFRFVTKVVEAVPVEYGAHMVEIFLWGDSMTTTHVYLSFLCVGNFPCFKIYTVSLPVGMHSDHGKDGQNCWLGLLSIFMLWFFDKMAIFKLRAIF